MLDPRTPVIVGAGQVACTDGDAPEPVDLLHEAARRCADGPAVAKVLAAVQSVRVVKVESRRYGDPGRLVADRLGRGEVETVYTTRGGQSPQVLVTEAAEEIRRGLVDAVLLGGAESMRTRRRIKRRGEQSNWTVQDPAAHPDRTIGSPLPVASEAEQAVGLAMPVDVYPLLEVAYGARHGWAPDEHVRRIAELWSRFSEVAAGNPYAAIPVHHDAERIATASPSNRMIAWPYRKLMVANDDVDQAAALLLCSVAVARAAGIPRDRWVFLHGAAAADDTPHVSERFDLSRSPALAAAGHAAMAAAGVGPDDIEFVDLYSCFPVAVEVAAEELGFSLGDRALTVTGGLTFAGGPWHNYTTHAIATLVERLRAAPESYGLCSANGGMLTKHAVGVYSCRPPVGGVVPVANPAFMPPYRNVETSYAGPATIEAYTIVHDRAGTPTRALVACRTATYGRVLATTDDSVALAALMKANACGTAVHVDHGRLL